MIKDKPYQLAVEVEAQYLPQHSTPGAGRYAFRYTITLHNTGSVAAQLIARHWVVADANGDTREMKGLGVVGQQPLLTPGEVFEYSSGCHLPTAGGTMHGSYFCVTEDGERFDVPVPPFVLSVQQWDGGPQVLH